MTFEKRLYKNGFSLDTSLEPLQLSHSFGTAIVQSFDRCLVCSTPSAFGIKRQLHNSRKEKAEEQN